MCADDCVFVRCSRWPRQTTWCCALLSLSWRSFTVSCRSLDVRTSSRPVRRTSSSTSTLWAAWCRARPSGSLFYWPSTGTLPSVGRSSRRAGSGCGAHACRCVRPRDLSLDHTHVTAVDSSVIALPASVLTL